MRRLRAKRSPTVALLLGLVITLAAVVAYTAYITNQLRGLRELQRDVIDRNRRDSLQLLRIQNDLNSLGLGLRDMLDTSQPYPLKAWSAEFQRLQGDLNDALRLEEELSVAQRTPEQRQYLEDSLAQFWVASDRIFALATEGNEKQARAEIRDSLQPALRLSARRWRGCWWPTTKAKSRRANGSSRFMTAYNARFTCFWLPR